MKRHYRLAVFVSLILGILVTVGWLVASNGAAILRPEGVVAEKQLRLMVLAVLLVLIVVVPVFVMTFAIVWKYRADAKKPGKYSPDYDHSHLAESVWWLIPLLIITVLSVIIVKSSHDLDPYKPLASSKKPLTVQVIALNWKWLFIYPEQNIATVNTVRFPVDTPINFRLTSDAPMNSFWIPQLGGQIYAMSGMETKLHLQASQPGDYQGSSANISGEGFAGMHFTATATNEHDFNTWVQSVKQSRHLLTMEAYETLAKPSKNNPPTYYAARDAQLYDTVMMKYMMPRTSSMGGRGMPTGSYHTTRSMDMTSAGTGGMEAKHESEQGY